jgi:hypothetical protein
MNDNQFPYSQLMQPDGNILSQEVITYVKRDNKIVKIVVNRTFTEDEYDDSMTTEVLCTW